MIDKLVIPATIAQRPRRPTSPTPRRLWQAPTPTFTTRLHNHMEAAVKTFFSSPRFAVAGASTDTSKFGYKVLAWYHAHSLPVTALNPRKPQIKFSTQTYDAVSSPSDLPSPSQTSLSVITPPAVTRKLLEEAKEAGIPAVWLQPGSFDRDGLEYAEANFKAAVGGEGGDGGEGWCVLVDGEKALRTVGREWKGQKL